MTSARAYRQVARLVALMLDLSARRLPVQLWTLATEYGVNKRTIRRDLSVLESLGAYVEWSGQGGGMATVRVRCPEAWRRLAS